MCFGKGSWLVVVFVLVIGYMLVFISVKILSCKI